MSDVLTPAQRLAVSRARLADTLSDPLWLMLLHRWLQAKDRPHAQASPPPPP